MLPSGHGAALANGYPDDDTTGTGHEWLLLTHDGGRTWASAATFSGGAEFDHVLFVDDRNGWLSGSGLSVTHDGGATWASVRTQGDVRELAASGSSVWAVEQRCPQNGQCAATTLASAGSNGVTALSPIPGTSPALVTAFAHPDSATGVFLVSGDGSQTARGSMAVTRDRGHSWTTGSIPCSAAGAAIGVSATSADRITVYCSVPSAAAPQRPGGGETFTTVDGGRTWSRHPSRAPSGLSYPAFAPTRGAVWALLSGGNRDTEAVFVATGSRTSWREALALTGDQAPLRESALAATDAEHAWYAVVQAHAAASRLVILRTSDGGRHWLRFVVPRLY
jgi:hypothetical protein